MSVRTRRPEERPKEKRLGKLLALVFGVTLILALLSLFGRKVVAIVKEKIEILKHIIVSRSAIVVRPRDIITIVKSVNVVTPRNVITSEHKVYTLTGRSVLTVERRVTIT